jgi:arginase
MGRICFIKVAYDSGLFNTRMGNGPLVLSEELSDFFRTENKPVSIREISINDLPFVTEIASVFELNRRLSKVVKEAKNQGEFPVILSGNCNSALGAISGCGSNTGIIWMDCHGDFNTPETTLGGFLDGMTLAIIAGRCWKNLVHSIPGFSVVPENKILLIGARDLDEPEEVSLVNSNITVVLSGELGKSVQFDYVFKDNEEVYVHIDLDILDPSIVKANHFATPGGFSPEELMNTIIEIKSKYTVAALTFASYDPSFDTRKLIPGIVTSIVKEFV